MYRNRTPREACYILSSLLLGIVGMWGCANMGTPEGGPYDMTPPRLVRSSPSVGAVQVKDRTLQLRFDEYIKLNKQQEKLIISPPQLQNPRITAVGKEISIRLEDSLRPNTTYSFYFADAIVDNNEDNPLEDFSYTFSTGDRLDSMRIAGHVLDARTLEPISDVLIGAYYAPEVVDTTFRHRPFAFVSKTDRLGRFVVRGLPDSLYRVYALRDDDRNYRYSQPIEGIAFNELDYRTSLFDSIKTDTIRIDSIVRRDTLYRDSLVTRPYTYYQPDTLLLRYFIAQSRSRGVDRFSRVDSLVCRIEFLEDLSYIPQLKSLDKPEVDRDELYHASVSGKVADYWLRDTDLIGQDSVSFALTYIKTDSLMQELEVTDTLTFHRPKEKKNERKREGGEERAFRLTLSGAKGIYAGTPYDSLRLEATRPIQALDRGQITLEAKVDSLMQPHPYRLVQDSLNTLCYYLEFERGYDQSYRVRIDSAAVRSIYGDWADSVLLEQRIVAENELGALKVELVGVDSLVIVELLDKGGEPLAQMKAIYHGRKGVDSLSSSSTSIAEQDSVLTRHLGQPLVGDSLVARRCVVEFTNLKPQDYYLRMYIDSNDDGRWTTGEYPYRQPEVVYYSPATYTIRKGFTSAELWDVLATPVQSQKPQALRKVKEEQRKAREDKNVAYYREHKKEAERKRKREERAVAKQQKKEGTK